MLWNFLIFILMMLSLSNCSSSETNAFLSGVLDRSLQGGATTLDDRSSGAFTNPAPNLNSLDFDLHEFGDENFEATFVDSGPLNPGLGPLFNNTSCVACHVGNGRGAPTIGSGILGSQLLVRVSIPAGIPEVPGGPGAVPGIGTQIQDHANVGSMPEATIQINYTENPGAYGDGTPFSLRSPSLVITPTGGPLPVDLMTSLRLPPPVFGLGLLEAIPEEVIENLADPSDSDGDGISGRTNHVWNPLTNQVELGRFGRKANTANLLLQAAGAYLEDMGVSNPVLLGGDLTPDISQQILDSTAFYTQTLAVPKAILLFDPQVIMGEALFKQINCSVCHVQQLMTGPSDISASLSFQVIFPYTDMLLHDMGTGLADDRPDFEATGTEWRTPPLWGIGATDIVLGSQATYLHDGRARSLEEAILWHDGEALQAKEAFRTFTLEEREAILAFLRSL